MQTTDFTARQILDFALLQSASECYLDGLDASSSPQDIQRKLEIGSNVPEKQNLPENDQGRAWRFLSINACTSSISC